MAEAAQKRYDPRAEATRAALIEAAESLFAECGVEGISTRRIGAAIGSANTNVVAYHFGGKEALIRAVYRHRLPEIDRRRGELLDAAERTGRVGGGRTGELAALVRVFYQPLYEQVDGQGRHSYARFMAAIDRSGLVSTRGEVLDEFPHSNRVTGRMAHCLPGPVAALLRERSRLVFALVSGALLQIDREAMDDSRRSAGIFENALAMAAAALAAPAPGHDIQTTGD